MMMPLHTKPVDWHHSSRRSVTEAAKGLSTLATERWKVVVAVVIGLLALSALVAGYFAWSSRNETNAAAFLRKAVSQLEASTRAGQDGAKQEEEGIRLLREVMSRYAGSVAAAEAALRLGTYYYTAGKYDEARTVYVTYLGQNPRGVIAFSSGIGVGDTYLAQRNYEKAAETYSRLVEQFPQDPLLPEAQLHLAKAYLGLNRPKDAIALYEKVVAAYPNTGWTQNAQAELNKLSITSH